MMHNTMIFMSHIIILYTNYQNLLICLIIFDYFLIFEQTGPRSSLYNYRYLRDTYRLMLDLFTLKSKYSIYFIVSISKIINWNYSIQHNLYKYNIKINAYADSSSEEDSSDSESLVSIIPCWPISFSSSSNLSSSEEE